MARGASHGSSEPLDHVGFYLIDRGQAELKAAFGYRPGWRERLLDGCGAGRNGSISGRSRSARRPDGARRRACAWAAVRLVVGPSPRRGLAAALSELAVGLVNQLLTLFLPPRVLPKLDFKDGIPTEHATFIVIPSMLARPSSAAVLLERLETHYLANPDPNLRFALLTDFTDAPQETMPQDEGLIDDAMERVRALNKRYARRRHGHLLPVPSPPALEPVAGLLDGLGTQARQAAGIQSAAPRRPRHELCRAECRPGELAADPLCDHAGRRHPDAARHGRPAGRNAGPPPQSAAVRRDSQGGWSRATACSSRGSAST